MNDIAARRARLAEIEGELARLQGLHDLAMSAFRFDEANAILPRIGTLEDERRSLIASLPAAVLAAEPEPGVVPVVARPRRVRRRR